MMISQTNFNKRFPIFIEKADKAVDKSDTMLINDSQEFETFDNQRNTFKPRIKVTRAQTEKNSPI